MRSPTTDDVELTRRAFATASAGDYDEMMAAIGPDSVWDVSPWGLGTHAGRRAIRRFFEDWIGAFDRWEVTVGELVDLGGVVYGAAEQRGWSTGVAAPLKLRFAPVFEWSEGMLVRSVHFRDLEEARALALALSRPRARVA